MRLIQLDNAVYEIHDLCKDHKERGRSAPYLFLIGAGVSHPPVPLAAEIVRHCTDVAKTKGRRREAASEDDPLSSYSFWFAQAYGQPSQRQAYLNDLIDGKSISQATLRLAHLLLGEDADVAPVANVVVTPNFDDFLTRALRLFGKPHVICDHPATSLRIDPERGGVLQVVHVHGTYQFYDCTNLTQEIELAARGDEMSVQTMAALLDRLFYSRSPLVVGYSGWERDVIMRSLKRRLQTRLGANLYWFCFKREDADRLPDWLSKHPDVRLVVPEPAAGSDATARVRAPRRGSDPADYARVEDSTPTDKRQGEPTLPAHQVFERLLATFGATEPEITRQPLKFFAHQLESLVPSEDLAGEAGIYGWSSVIERVRAAELPGDALDREAEEESGLERVRQAIRKVNYGEAVEAGVRLVREGRVEGKVVELLRILFTAAERLPDGVDKLEALEAIRTLHSQALDQGMPLDEDTQATVAKALNLAARALLGEDEFERALSYLDDVAERFAGSEQPAIQIQASESLRRRGDALLGLDRPDEALVVYREVVSLFGSSLFGAVLANVAWALFDSGLVLRALNRPDESQAAYQEVIDRFGDLTEPELEVPIAYSLVNRAFMLKELKRFEEALEVCSEVVHRFEDAEKPTLQEQVAKALFSRGGGLSELGNPQDAIKEYDEVVSRFGNAPDLALRSMVATALRAKISLLAEIGRDEDALSASDDIVRRLVDSEEPELQEDCAWALFSRGVLLNDLDRLEEAVAAYSEVLQLFGDSAHLRLQIPVAQSMVNLGVALEKLDRRQEAARAYEGVVLRFADSTAEPLAEQVFMARANEGWLQVQWAKEFLLQGHGQDATAKLSHAVESIRQAVQMVPDDLEALCNLAYTEFILGRKEEARELLKHAIGRGGEEVRAAALRDSQDRRLPIDDEYDRLVKSIEVPTEI